MILFIKRSLAFIMLMISVFLILNVFQSFYNIEPEHYKKQYESITHFDSKYDGIILGASHATHGIQPKILDESGIRFYNYSLNGSNPEYILNWYNRFLHYRKEKPNFCLFSVDYFMFDKKWLWRTFEQDVEYFPLSVIYDEWRKENSNTSDLIVNYFPVLKYRGQIKQSLLLKKGSPFVNVNKYDRGYISYERPFKNKLFKPQLEYKVDTSQVNYFISLLKQMKEDNITIFFIIIPEYGISTYEYSQMRSLNIIDSIALKFNISVLNYNTELRSDINQNIDYFSDWGHMNHHGSKIFSKQLAIDLKDRLHKNGHKEE